MINYQTFQNIALISLENNKNLLSEDFVSNLNKLIDKTETDPLIRIIVLSIKTPFVGADLKELQETKKTSDFIEPWQRLSLCQKPVICALNAMTLGGGLEIALMADILIANPSVQLGQPEINVGVIPGSGATQRLTKLIGPYHTSFLCMTGTLISAAQAHAWGIIQLLSENAEEKAVELAHSLASKSLPLLQSIKRCVRKASELPLSEGLSYERSEFYKNLKLYDHKEGISSFLEKRKPEYTHA